MLAIGLPLVAHHVFQDKIMLAIGLSLHLVPHMQRWFKANSQKIPREKFASVTYTLSEELQHAEIVPLICLLLASRGPHR